LTNLNLFIQIVLKYILKLLLSLFCKTGKTHKTYILQEKQEDGFIFIDYKCFEK